MVIAEDLDDKFAAAPDTNLVEHRLQMILNGGTRGLDVRCRRGVADRGRK